MTESEHEATAREFVDGILEINRRHGEDSAPAVIEYEDAVEAASGTFRYLREDTTDNTAAEPA